MTTPTSKTESSRVRRTRVVAGSARRATPVDQAYASTLADFRDFLADLDLGITPSVHVNGRAFTSCLVTVDLGQPLKSVRLNAEQADAVTDRLRDLARRVLGREATIRVHHDGHNGVYWASVI